MSAPSGPGLPQPGPGQAGYQPPRRYGDARLDAGGSFGPAGAAEIRRRQMAAANRGTFQPEAARRVVDRRGIGWRRLRNWVLLPLFVLFAVITVYGLATLPVTESIVPAICTVVLFLLVRYSARRVRQARERPPDIR